MMTTKVKAIGRSPMDSTIDDFMTFYGAVTECLSGNLLEGEEGDEGEG